MSHESTAADRWVIVAAVVGVGAALVAFIEGIVLMAKQTPGVCHQGSADVDCIIHPRAAEGLALSAISLTVGVLVLLLAYVSYVAVQLHRSENQRLSEQYWKTHRDRRAQDDPSSALD
jgi:hypothetical protein